MRNQLLSSAAGLRLAALICSALLAATVNGQVVNHKRSDAKAGMLQLKKKIERMELQVSAINKELEKLRSLLRARTVMASTPGDSIKYEGRLDRDLVPEVSFFSLFCKPATAEDQKRIPTALSTGDRAFIGTLQLLKDGGFTPMFALVKPAQGIPYVFVDINQDGLLSTGESFQFQPLEDNKYYGGEVVLKLPFSAGVYSYFPVMLRYWRCDRLNSEGSLELAQSSRALARGVVNVARRETRVVYTFELKAKRVNPRREWVGIDANGDGQVELNETSPECAFAQNEDVILRVRDRYISTVEVATATGRIVLTTHPAAEYERIELSTGTRVPNFSFTDLDGNARSLSEFRGKYVLLDFWARWCGAGCEDRVLHLKDIYEKYRSRGFDIIGINRDSIEELEGVRNFVAARGIRWTQTPARNMRELIEKRFRLWSSGRRILLDPDGKIILAGYEGEPGLQDDKLSGTLEKVLR